MKRKSVAYRLAEHFGCDVDELREYDYHAGMYSPKVYAGMDGNNYWSAGPRKPRYHGGEDTLEWRRIEPTQTNIGTLWVADGSEDA